MPAERRMPPDRELAAMIRKHGQAGTARQLGVSRQAVSKAAKKIAYAPPSGYKSYAEFIPWKVGRELNGAFETRYLRALARRERGEANLPHEERNLDAWLAAMDDRGMVVDFDGNTFVYRPREPRDGAGYVRQPQPTD